MKTTAEDILNKVVGWSNEITEDMAIEAMIIFAELKCDEQRNICVNNLDPTSPRTYNDVINSPRPEIK
jgi:CRISPR/Cas system endoribonuclease Cas6 (RAMP superfamily)